MMREKVLKEFATLPTKEGYTIEVSDVVGGTVIVKVSKEGRWCKAKLNLNTYEDGLQILVEGINELLGKV